MAEPVFLNQVSSDFWQHCHGMTVEQREIIKDILCVLDSAAHESSVRSRYPARGAYHLQGRVRLLEHSVSVATICRELTTGIINQGLAVIAGLGHDCGKLPELHPGRYASVMHAHWGAEYVNNLVKGRLIAVQARAVVNAIRYHSIGGDGCIVEVLRSADKKARGAELSNGTKWRGL